MILFDHFSLAGGISGAVVLSWDWTWPQSQGRLGSVRRDVEKWCYRCVVSGAQTAEPLTVLQCTGSLLHTHQCSCCRDRGSCSRIHFVTVCSWSFNFMWYFPPTVPAGESWGQIPGPFHQCLFAAACFKAPQESCACLLCLVTTSSELIPRTSVLMGDENMHLVAVSTGFGFEKSPIGQLRSCHRAVTVKGLA